MTQFDKFAATRRDALKVGLAGAVASSALLGVTRAALADDTLAEIKKRGVLTTATEMQFPPVRYLRQWNLQGRRPRSRRRGG